MRVIHLLLILILIPLAALASPRDRLVIKTANGDAVFSVELAATPEQKTLGLMHRRELAADAGMLFDFAKSAHVTMWMKDTLIPLDMLFIDSGGVVVNIAVRTIPESLTPIESHGAVRAVLELNGGTCGRLGIQPGDKVLHPIFDNQQ